MNIKPIKLFNRYGLTVKLVPIKRSVYKLEFDSNTYRISRKDDGTINFIDPIGGPFITEGLLIDRYKEVKSIEYNSNDNYFIIKTNRIKK